MKLSALVALAPTYPEVGATRAALLPRHPLSGGTPPPAAAQAAPGQAAPGQAAPGQAAPGQAASAAPEQPAPRQAVLGQPAPAQAASAQAAPAQPAPAQPAPAQPAPAASAQAASPQAAPAQVAQAASAQAASGQPALGQSAPAQAALGQDGLGQAALGQDGLPPAGLLPATTVPAAPSRATAAPAPAAPALADARLGVDLPAGYHHLRYRRKVGRGAADFHVAAGLLHSWRMHRAAGARVSATGPAVEGETVVVRIAGLRAPCRVVWSVPVVESDAAGVAGFGYGTLPGHPVRGEEGFLVTLTADGDVWFDLAAFSGAATWLAKLTGPVGRLAQRLIAHRYAEALASAVKRSH